MRKITDTEVRYRIEQAFQLAPTMTVGMLKAYLNARIPLEIRTAVLEQLKKEGKIVAENRTLSSFKGMTSQVTVLRWVGVAMIEEGRKRAS